MRLAGLIILVAAWLALSLANTAAQSPTNRPARTLPITLVPIAPLRPPPASEPAAVPAFSGSARPLIVSPSPAAGMASNLLAFAHEEESAWITNGAPAARYDFVFTNVSSTAITITNVALSCGCISVEHPPLPWLLPPGDSARLPVTLEVAGRTGTVVKTVELRTDHGFKTVVVRAAVHPPDPAD